MICSISWILVCSFSTPDGSPTFERMRSSDDVDGVFRTVLELPSSEDRYALCLLPDTHMQTVEPVKRAVKRCYESMSSWEAKELNTTAAASVALRRGYQIWTLCETPVLCSKQKPDMRRTILRRTRKNRQWFLNGVYSSQRVSRLYWVQLKMTCWHIGFQPVIGSIWPLNATSRQRGAVWERRRRVKNYDDRWILAADGDEWWWMMA